MKDIPNNWYEKNQITEIKIDEDGIVKARRVQKDNIAHYVMKIGNKEVPISQELFTILYHEYIYLHNKPQNFIIGEQYKYLLPNYETEELIIPI